jgi:Ca-activated chloride channel family protein
MNLGNPQFLVPLGLAGAALLALALWTFFRDRRDLRELGHRNLVLSPALALSRRVVRMLGLFLALGACALGATRWLGHPIPGESGQYGLDVVVALDVSKSMLSRDVRPNRLEAAKNALLDSLESMQGNRVAFEVFAGEAFLQVPLTLDMEAVATVLEGADVDAVDLGGTNIAEAIQTALESFPVEEKEPSKRGRVLLLYTDGEPTAGEGDLEAALAEARKRRVAVACIGVGTPKGQAIPDGQSFWGEAQYKKDDSGRVVVSRLDEETLKGIASATGGLYVAGDSPAALAKVEGLLSRLEKSMIRGKDAMKRQELAPAMGWVAALCLLAAVVL